MKRFRWKTTKDGQINVESDEDMEDGEIEEDNDDGVEIRMSTGVRCTYPHCAHAIYISETKKSCIQVVLFEGVGAVYIQALFRFTHNFTRSRIRHLWSAI